MASAQFKETESISDENDVDADRTSGSEIEKNNDHFPISGVQEISTQRPSNTTRSVQQAEAVIRKREQQLDLVEEAHRFVQIYLASYFIAFPSWWLLCTLLIMQRRGWVPAVLFLLNYGFSSLEDLFNNENLTYDTTEANLSLGDISEDDEIWVFDIPKTINPKNFKGQSIKLGKKNNFQVGNELYETCSSMSDSKQHLSFVFNTGRRKRPYKTINVKPAGCVQVRQKLASVVDIHLVSTKKASVPFPKNLKLRHPLFGHDYQDKLLSVEK